MEEQTTRKYKWFWAWQDNKREEWLRQMSLAGWHLTHIDMLGLAFNFTKGDPRDYNYRLDFRIDKKLDREEYLDFIKDAGWEHIESKDGWYYFRKPSTADGTSEFFTDNESKAMKYKRLMATLAIFYPGFLIVFLANLEKYPTWFAILLVSVFVLLIIFVSTSLIGVALRIRELERQSS